MNTIAEIIDDIRNGKMVILVDDEDRENEGDLIVATDFVTPDIINFMAKEARGLICLALPAEQIDRLSIPLMVQDDRNFSPNKTAFTVSIEASSGVSTGISTADRAHTIRVAANPQSTSKDITMPGHIFPIKAQEGGVLKRAGHTEASVDLSILAGLTPGAAICEIMNLDGTMARTTELMEFAKKFSIKIGTIEDLIKYRLENESYVEEIAKAHFPTTLGEGFKVRIFQDKLDGREHLVLTKGEVDPEKPILVRVHTECVMGDVFESLRTQSREYIKQSMERISEEGCGVLVYLRMEDMGQRLLRRVKAYERVDQGDPTNDSHRAAFHSDKKDYGVGAQILRKLGVRKMRLMANNVAKLAGLKGYGLEVVEMVPFEITSDPLLEIIHHNQQVTKETIQSVLPIDTKEINL